MTRQGRGQLHRGRALAAVLAAVLVLAGCSLPWGEADRKTDADTLIVEKIPGYNPVYPGVNDAAGLLGEQDGAADSYTFLTISDRSYTVDLDPDALGNPYHKSDFWRDGDIMSYRGDGYTAVFGIDVSDHNGEIDWTAARDQGVAFAFLRVGYRGYTEGGIHEDTMFRKNITAARKAGISVGAYFFSQAINEEEAIEEAQFVLDIIKDYGLELPIVYDPETVYDDDARTNGLSKRQLTANALAFCDVITASGYEPCLYVNNMWQAYSLDMASFNDIPIWLADYRDQPQSPYHFEYWQYSYHGNGAAFGSDDDIDLDIRLLPDDSQDVAAGI